jgi:hypothetical protein
MTHCREILVHGEKFSKLKNKVWGLLATPRISTGRAFQEHKKSHILSKSRLIKRRYLNMKGILCNTHLNHLKV